LQECYKKRASDEYAHLLLVMVCKNVTKKEQAMPYAHLLFVMVCKNVTKKGASDDMLIFFL
jgi:hypothetical protein